MPQKSDVLKTNFVVDCKIESFYHGGSLALNKLGDRLFTICGDQINCVDLKSGKIKFVIGIDETENEVTSLTLSPSDDFLIVAYKNLLLKQFDLSFENEPKIHRIWKSGHRGPVTCMAFSEDSLILATGSSDATVKIWDTQAQYCTHTLKNASGCITCVQFAPDSWNRTENHYFIAFADDVGKVFVNNLKKDQRHAISLSHHSSAVTVILFDEQYIYTAGRDSVIVQCDRTTKFTVAKIIPIFESVETMVFLNRLPGDVKLRSSTFTDDKKFIMTAGESGRLKIWSLVNSKCLYTLQVSKKSVDRIICCDETRSFLVSTLDQIILSVNSDDFLINKQLVGNNEEVYDAAFVSMNDKSLVVATNSNDVRIYDVESFNCQLLSGHSDAVLAVDVAPWNCNVFSTCSKDNKVFVWRCFTDYKNFAVHQCTATGHANSVTCVRFSRLKPAFLASVSDDKTLKLWKLPSNFQTLEETNEGPLPLTASATVIAHQKEIPALDVSPNDKIIATCSMDKTIKLWSVTSKLTLTPMGTINEHKRGVWDVKFSPTDQVIASCSGDFTVKIFALEDLSCLKTFEGHQATVLRLHFLANGLQLVSADTAGLIKLWTIRTNECVRTLEGHESKVFALNINSAGNKMVSGGADAKVLLWRDITTEDRSEENLKRMELIANEQKLSNLVENKKYSDALRLALILNRPFNALNVLKKIFADPDGDTVIGTVIKSLKSDQINVLLTYLVEWNSNSRHFYVAQKVLSSILKSVTPEDLLKLPNIKETVEGLTPYSERHFERLSKVRQQAYFVDFTWETAKVLNLLPTAIKIENE